MKQLFSQDEVFQLSNNPYTLSVTEQQIRFTIPFKKYLYERLQDKSVTVKQAFKEAGYDPALLGASRMSSIVRAVRREARSPKGFRETGRSQKNL